MKPAIQSEKTFALILVQHRRWGSVLAPYILERQKNVAYYSMYEALAPFPDNNTLSGLDNSEKEVVRLANEYSDRNLFKLFSKSRNVKEFIDTVDDSDFEQFIKPYIESRISQSLHIALTGAIPVFLQKPRITTLHPEDRLSVSPDTASPVFNFEREPRGSSYSLVIEAGNDILDLRGQSTEILSNKPCVIRYGSLIYFISEIEGTKLKPFLTRSSIMIPKATEEKYFSTFVLSVVNTHRFTGNGFTVVDREPVREAFITVERDIRGIAVAILSFTYGGREIYATEEVSRFTTFTNEKGHFIFRRYMRNRKWENGCAEALEDAGLFSDDGISFMAPGARDDNGNSIHTLVETIAAGRARLTGAGITIRSGSLDLPYSFEPVEMKVSHHLINDWFDVRAIVQIGAFTIPFTRLRRNILEGIREYTLPDGTVAILPEEWFARYRTLFELGSEDEGVIKVHKQHFGIITDVISGDDCDICQKLEKLNMPEQLPLLNTPAGLRAELRPYQAEGISWLYYLQTNNLGGCLADDMGLGKTLQTLALLLYNREDSRTIEGLISEEQMSLFGPEEKRLPSLIIVPASLSHNWFNEVKRFCPTLRTLVHQGTGRARSSAPFQRYDLVISTYHTVRQDIEFLVSVNFFYIVLDESQNIKNPSSNIYRAVTQLRAKHRLVLTGTPVENSLTDLWTQLNFVNPGLLGSLNFFKREFARPVEKYNDEEKEKRLKKIIQPFIMRRTKEMVLHDLPPVTEQVVYCDMSEIQAAIYEKEKSVVRNSILENIEAMGIEKSAILVLQGLMRLRQIANHPLLTDDSYDGGSGKFDIVTGNIESVVSEGHKILIFSSFVKHLELFPEWLEKKGIGFSMLTGSTTDREKVIRNFREDDSVRVFLISLKAGGVGLNLTEADYVFILDPWWNPASEIQALSRTHRIGQHNRVFVYRYISTDTIEEKIQRLQEKKTNLADTFVESNNPLAELDIKGMLDILN